jgi:hypothetical protein
MRRYASRIPIALTTLRAALGPAVVLLALDWPSAAAFAVCLTLAFLSDYFDGVIARRLGVARYVYDFRKFGREASYHMWSSKLWGITLVLAFYALLVFGQAGWLVALAIYVGIAADLEGLAISSVLPRWRTDVRTIFHALSLRAEA